MYACRKVCAYPETFNVFHVKNRYDLITLNAQKIGLIQSFGRDGSRGGRAKVDCGRRRAKFFYECWRDTVGASGGGEG